MIHSASSSSSSVRHDALTAASTTTASRITREPSDQLNTDKADALRTSLRDMAEIRPEVVERAKALAADPGYPSDAIIKQISSLIVKAPDLSEDLT